jgi:hypothetical protein
MAGTAQAQGISLSVQFRSALEPHGRWVKHQRWGEVWTPARRDRDWRPYAAGRWVFTDEWGWYWVSDEDFGWVTYHYGRWVPDREFGWIWIPGNEWGPAWVQWRRGDRYAGWAPLPPQDVIYDYDDDPDFWIFVNFNNFTAPNIRRVLVPRQQYVVYIRETVVVNRTIIVDRGPRIAVNPGIDARIVAARTGRPVRVADVKPAVLAGTVGVRGAVEVRSDRRERVRVEVTERKETIAATKDVPPPQALKKGEEGRLGDRPPAAAKDQAQQQPAATKGQPDAKGKGDDATKTKADDAAKEKDATKAKDFTKAKDDTAKGKDTDSAKAKDDAAKSKALGDKGKQPEPKAESKSKDADKGKQPAATGKSEPAPKAPAMKDDAKAPAEPKQKSVPDQKQSAPKAPEPQKQSAPKAPEPQKQSAPEPKKAEPKVDAKGGKGKDEEKGKGG